MISDLWRRGGLRTRTVMVIALAVALYSLLTVVAVGIDAGAAVAAVAVVGGAITAVLLWLVARLALPGGTVSGSEARFAVVWGGLVATCLASLLNDVGPGFLIAPFVEELLKITGVVIVLRILGTATPARGFVLGFLVGGAFEVYENVLYIAMPETPYEGGAMPLLTAVAVRVFVGFGLHAVTTALVGAAVGYTVTARGRLVGGPSAAALGAAIVIHLAWDVGPETGVAGLVLMAADYAVIVTVFVLTRRRTLALTAGSPPGPLTG
ncbi:PrsW family glutamic-type intramembrane protease [Gordonia phthalatica]|uniref:Protease PrsW n=1 Tax=Gordonia phthalatica TaxID=1136941 RepID=A0A0N9N9V4_9ACTN|nr:PrsW family glutamic-type intramembrane protease [Gordonia phthalatica]ALG84070.1 hypothetical protein ACH46_05575 [Gordonia phthalatica]